MSANTRSTCFDYTVANSFYLRILAVNPGISGHEYNDAVSGSKMTNLASQVSSAVSQGVQYVTIAMGANDACTSSESTMTSVSTYQSQFQSAMGSLTSGLPGVKISVGSIPDVYYLWQLFHTNSTAVNVWTTASICQSMFANATSTSQTDEDRRQRVRQRIIDFNTALANVCATYANCQWDSNTAFNYHFATSEVSTRDYFHPSVTGQAKIAAIEWPLVTF
jgi:lysophospholipase L1-like esterase